MKKALIALTLVIALVSGCLMGCDTQNTEPTDNKNNDSVTEMSATIFTLDINPGIRIFVDENGVVIGIEATNEDGEVVVEEIDFEGKDYETVVEEIIDLLEEMGYIPDEEGFEDEERFLDGRCLF